MGNPYVASRMLAGAWQPKIARMPTKKFTPHPAREEDATVSWARRKETIRGALKLFRVLLDAVKRHAEWVESRHGIGGAQLWVLWELSHTPGMRAVDMAKNMAVHRHTAEAMLNELLGKNLVRQEVGGEAHSPVYVLTPLGQRIADASPEHGQGVLKAALEQLPDAALEQVVASMRAVTESLPFREDRAALRPMADLLRPTVHEATPQAVAGSSRNKPEN